MALPGETLATGAPDVCPECGTRLQLEVLRSAAGYYIGTRCECGPYSRESAQYWRTREEAKTALRSGNWERR